MGDKLTKKQVEFVDCMYDFQEFMLDEIFGTTEKPASRVWVLKDELRKMVGRIEKKANRKAA